MSDPSSLLEFPCVFPVKAMGRLNGDFERTVSGIILRHASVAEGEDIVSRPSGNGNFVSVTVVIRAESREQLDRIYQDLTDCEQVLMAL
jgi:putative lipoic acid-binding regulatory protein